MLFPLYRVNYLISALFVSFIHLANNTVLSSAMTSSKLKLNQNSKENKQSPCPQGVCNLIEEGGCVC